MSSYKERLESFLSEKSNREYAFPIVQGLTVQYTTGKIARLKREKGSEGILEVINEVIKDALEERRYTASIFPTIISPEKARNFYIGKEGGPTEEEIHKFLYLLVSGLHYGGEFVINLDNVADEARKDFRDGLINEKMLILPSVKGRGGIDIARLLSGISAIRKSFPRLSEFIFAFLLISYFSSWIREEIKRKGWSEVLAKMGLESTLGLLGIRDDVTLIVFRLSKGEKKKVYYIPKLKDVLVKWFSDYIGGREGKLAVVDFIFSLYVADEKYRDISSETLNKFLYYFLNGYVNGELLSKLIQLKIKCELEREGRVYGVLNAKEFFSKL